MIVNEKERLIEELLSIIRRIEKDELKSITIRKKKDRISINESKEKEICSVSVSGQE
jgi:hypothetical protein